MKQLTEDYVSFEIAKLLKEKGFDEPCIGFYNPIDGCFFEASIRKSWDYNKHGSINAPTLQMALKWLREVHNLSIEIYRTACGYISCIVAIPSGTDRKLLEEGGDDKDSGQWTTFEKCVEASLLYVLKNLI